MAVAGLPGRGKSTMISETTDPCKETGWSAGRCGLTKRALCSNPDFSVALGFCALEPCRLILTGGPTAA
jgi:hypothetical protein